MSEDTPPPETPLQFDIAEFTGTQPVAPTCAVCKRPVVQTYYMANKAIICNECHAQVKASVAGGSKFGRVFAATALGVLAGLAGAALWYAVRKITGWEIGLVAIVVGLMVGVAVRKGSGARGGWFYQSLAILLTYCSICAQYVPDLVEIAMKKFHEDKAIAAKNHAAADAHDKAAAKNEPAKKPVGDDGEAAKPERHNLLLAIAIVLVLLLALPIQIGMQSPISLLIVGFALYEAWKINKGSAIRFTGPFRLAPQAASGAPDL